MRMSTRRAKPFGLLAALLALVLLAAACAGDDEEAVAEPPPPAPTPPAETEAPATDEAPPPPPAAEPSGPLRVAVVAPSASNDLAFTQSIVDGVAALGETRALEVEITDGTFIVEDAAVAIREYAEAGFDLVIAHGSQYGGSLQEIAPDFPDVSFAWGTSVDTFGLANVFAYTAASDQGGYVLGSMAAALTDTGVVGVVGPIEVGDAKLFVDGFVAGAGSQDSSVDVNVVYTESFSDVAKAAETAEAHVSQGADVMTGTAQMVVGAVGVAQREGAAWFATQSDQAELAPEIVVASQVYEWEVVLADIAASIDRGVLGGEAFTITLANGGLNIAFNDGYGLDASIRQIGEDAVAGIIDGSIDTMGGPAAEPSGPLRVAVVAPSASNDLAFTQSIVDGVAALGETRALEVEITDGTFIVEDAAVAIREYAEAGFDLVIAHGSQYGGSLQEIAPDFPDVSFAWGTSVDTFGLANVFAYTAASDQGGYVLGSMAAALTDTGVVGVVGPIEVGDAKLFVDGFVAGAGSQDSSVDVNVVYTESFSDVAKAAETAEAHVSQGADVMTGTAQMVVGAVGVAQREGAAWFATQSDQAELAPEIVVASQVYEWEVVLADIAASIDRGVLGGEAFTITLANGGLNIAFNDGYGLDASIRQIGEDAVAGIIDGSIETLP